MLELNSSIFSTAWYIQETKVDDVSVTKGSDPKESPQISIGIASSQQKVTDKPLAHARPMSFTHSHPYELYTPTSWAPFSPILQLKKQARKVWLTYSRLPSNRTWVRIQWSELQIFTEIHVPIWLSISFMSAFLFPHIIKYSIFHPLYPKAEYFQDKVYFGNLLNAKLFLKSLWSMFPCGCIASH